MSLYARHAGAFGPEGVERALVLADHAVIAIEASRLEDRATSLEAALIRSRMIGAAMGILIERHKLTPEGAFDRLRNASQAANRKVADSRPTSDPAAGT